MRSSKIPTYRNLVVQSVPRTHGSFYVCLNEYLYETSVDRRPSCEFVLPSIEENDEYKNNGIIVP